MEIPEKAEHGNRLDVEMHRRGFARSRSAATDLIKRGKVSVNGIVAKKASVEVLKSDVISLADGISYVSRAGEKLASALSRWKISVAGMTALDIGSSTGGFTDCLLKNGASKVIAVDTGTNQLDPSIAADSRVESHEGTDIREFSLASPADVAVIDVSFISLALILPKAFDLVKPGAQVVALVKPQFEVGKEIADKRKGIVVDPTERAAAFESVRRAALTAGFEIIDRADSPLPGEKGNLEFLLLLRRPE
ncbi:MAG TPA: TlyA family RNA methyltransferase [Candidatus Paceibacterota bacterium]|nr:TlyA family RNA methyltransferase [Candidatus Paceibacterota bacterium]